MEQTWKHPSPVGVVTLIHPESHFTDEKAGELRERTYLRLKRHWQFNNELKLYDIHNKARYGIHIYGQQGDHVNFIMASSLYHPDTIERSLKHDGTGDEPGLKDPAGAWDLRPHRERIINVTDETLQTWHAIMEDTSIPTRRTRMVYTVNRAASDTLGAISRQPRIGSLGLEFSSGWHESIDRKKGYFESAWGIPASWNEVILQGPHLFVATPLYKEPNSTMKSNKDWSATDFETISADAIPATSYKPTKNVSWYNSGYGQWKSGPIREQYRVAWRAMAGHSNERTLIPAIIPPGAAHPNTIFSIGKSEEAREDLCVIVGFLSSLIADFAVRTAPTSNIYMHAIERLPVIIGHHLQGALILRTLRLNCITSAYSTLWHDIYQDSLTKDQWASGSPRINRPALGDVTCNWTVNAPLRIAEDRRRALVEIDAIIALMLGIPAEQLCTIYRTQFSVLYGYDHKDYVYDLNGRLVPNDVLYEWRKKGDQLSTDERTATNQAGNTYTYELPFRLLDREADMRAAYAEFERRVAAHE
jgi:hypothetical protein